jgi:hypothetical protein
MKQPTIFLIFIVSATLTLGQNSRDDYSYFSKKADSLYKAKDFKNAAFTYSEAFKSLGWKGSPIHRYNAACSWALAGVADSAFFQLDNIATKANYIDYARISTDANLKTLHQDKRWKSLLEIIKQNKDKADEVEAKLNKPLISRLDSMFKEDQRVRIQVDTIEKKYGWESTEMKAHLHLINRTDSINLIKVKQILDKYGWLGSDVIGSIGNLTLFLVIQHADLATQEKYLPMMREAVKNGKASAYNLALLEDRVAMRQGKKQIYGSQIGRDKETNAYYILPLEDPDNVDKRRAEVGLQSLAEYVKQWQIKWDVEQYKKDLPAIEAKEKARPK